MPGGISPYHANRILDYEFGLTTWTPEGTYYVGLLSTMPDEDGVGYAVASGIPLLAVTNNTTNFPAAALKTKKNGTVLSWAAFPGDRTLVGGAIFDDSSMTHILRWGPFSSPVTVEEDQPFEVAINGAQFTVRTPED
jgi:hypothetical protein